MAFGKGALGAEDTGSASVAIGKEALRDQDVGAVNSNNTAVGFDVVKL